MTNLDSILKSREIILPTKVHIIKAVVFPVVMYRCELDHKEGWAPKNWCFWIVVLEKTLESPLDCKEIKPFNPKGNQSWIFTGRTDAEAEAPILWPPDMKSWLIGKDPDAGMIEGRRRRGWQKTWDCWMTSLTQWTWVWANWRSLCAATHGVTKSWARLSNWTTIGKKVIINYISVQYSVGYDF